MAERGWETFQGLNAILESPRWPIAKKCQAVDGCVDLNRRVARLNYCDGQVLL